MQGRQGGVPSVEAFLRRDLSVLLIIAICVLVSCAGPPASKPLHVNLTDSDIALAATAMQATLEHESTGETRTWRNPETGHAGAMMPQRTYLSEAGFYCRDYQETLSVDGRSETYADTACRDADGIWRWID
jgi:surface antigen